MWQHLSCCCLHVPYEDSVFIGFADGHKVFLVRLNLS